MKYRFVLTQVCFTSKLNKKVDSLDNFEKIAKKSVKESKKDSLTDFFEGGHR